MSANIVSKEKNTVKFTYEVGPERLEEGLKFAYNKNKGQFALPGFRKGHVPRKMVEMQYGVGVLFDDAVNHILSEDYEGVIKELALEVVDRPEIEVDAISKEEGAKFTISVTVRPEVTLGQYKGLPCAKLDLAVTEEEVNAEIDRAREQNARTVEVTDRPAKLDDIVTISYLGTVDGVPFEGGQSDSYDLTLGSHSFIDTFEDQIVGHNVGDKFDVNVTFPTEYHAEELAGKAAVFAVELKAINEKELPELNDEFAQDVSEFDTLEEYKADVLAKLKEAKEKEEKSKRTDALLTKVVENAQMDVPAVMIESQADRMLNQFAMNLAGQGLNLETYCQFAGTTPEEMKKGFFPAAERTVKGRLALEAVVDAEKIEATEDEMKAKVEEMAGRMGIGLEQMLEYMNDEDKASVKKDVAVEKAIQLVEDAAVEE